MIPEETEEKLNQALRLLERLLKDDPTVKPLAEAFIIDNKAYLGGYDISELDGNEKHLNF